MDSGPSSEGNMLIICSVNACMYIQVFLGKLILMCTLSYTGFLRYSHVYSPSSPQQSIFRAKLMFTPEKYCRMFCMCLLMLCTCLRTGESAPSGFITMSHLIFMVCISSIDFMHTRACIVLAMNTNIKRQVFFQVFINIKQRVLSKIISFMSI
ncbi:hypothetical protein NEIRO03_2402 [Nematocida sp. AWRm78]|nr:hypothetical protein NEIRO03_2402 [Nematocida sp. AWRm78]